MKKRGNELPFLPLPWEEAVYTWETCVCVCVCVCVCERERERGRGGERERETERQREKDRETERSELNEWCRSEALSPARREVSPSTGAVKKASQSW